MRYQGPRCVIVNNCSGCGSGNSFAPPPYEERWYCCHYSLRGPKELDVEQNITGAPPNWCPLERWHE
jgi:hypothetical protein